MLVSCGFLAAALPHDVAAQFGVVVEGRVVESGGAPIALASVELEGLGATLTSQDGDFRFERVATGGYTLHVVAFGHAPVSRFVVLASDTTMTIELEASAIPLDSLTVDLRAVDIEGVVRDPDNDFSLVDIVVLTDQGRSTRTDSHGRFELEGVFEGVPLQIAVRAFGYLPMDSVIDPREDGRYVFELEADPLVQAMVETQVERLAVRASPRFVAGMRNLNRDRLLRYAGSATVWDVLLFEYGERKLGRLGSRNACILIDEVQHEVGPGTRALLMHMLPEELERIEFMFSGTMLRVYTREFMQQMISRDMPLRRPFMFGGICL
jgi:hypothetical protein